MKLNWKKGNGTLVFGLCIMMVTMSICIMFVQNFIVRQNALSAQTAVDSIADGTAVYLANEGGDYDDAVEKALEIQRLVAETTGVKTDDLELDEEALDDNLVTVSTKATYDYTAALRAQFDWEGGDTYTLLQSATTEFSGMFSNIDYVNWMIEVAADDTHGYSMDDRIFAPDVDCSSFVFYALKAVGYPISGYPFNTAGMPPLLKHLGFNQIPYSRDILQPGDILWYSAGFEGHGVGHTEVYIGDGMTVGAHSNYDDRTGDSSGQEVNVQAMGGKNYHSIFRLGN